MTPQIHHVLKKYNVNRFNMRLEDVLTFVFETDRQLPSPALGELAMAISQSLNIKNYVLPEQLALSPELKKETPTKGDNVNHPAHYTMGKFEVIDVIEDWKLNHHRATAVKYIARAGRKNASKEIEDLEKGIWYLKREVERLKSERIHDEQATLSANASNFSRFLGVEVNL